MIQTGEDNSDARARVYENRKDGFPLLKASSVTVVEGFYCVYEGPDITSIF
jgi:hypothetical protein